MPVFVIDEDLPRSIAAALRELNRNLLKALTTLTEEDFPGNLIIIEPGRVRIRRAG